MSLLTLAVAANTLLCRALARIRGRGGLLGHQSESCHWFSVLSLDPRFTALVRRLVVPDHVDANGCEDGPVEQRLRLTAGLLVKRAGTRQQRQKLAKPVSYDLDVVLTAADELFGVLDLAQNGCLTGLEVGLFDHSVEVGINETLLFSLQRDEAVTLSLSERLILFVVGFELLPGEPLDFLDLFLRERDTSVPFLPNLGFKCLSRDIRQVTAGAAGMAAKAEEVGVLSTTAASIAKAHAPAAPVADQ